MSLISRNVNKEKEEIISGHNGTSEGIKLLEKYKIATPGQIPEKYGCGVITTDSTIPTEYDYGVISDYALSKIKINNNHKMTPLSDEFTDKVVKLIKFMDTMFPSDQGWKFFKTPRLTGFDNWRETAHWCGAISISAETITKIESRRLVIKIDHKNREAWFESTDICPAEIAKYVYETFVLDLTNEFETLFANYIPDIYKKFTIQMSKIQNKIDNEEFRKIQEKFYDIQDNNSYIWAIEFEKEFFGE